MVINYNSGIELRQNNRYSTQHVHQHDKLTKIKYKQFFLQSNQKKSFVASRCNIFFFLPLRLITLSRGLYKSEPISLEAHFIRYVMPSFKYITTEWTTDYEQFSFAVRKKYNSRRAHGNSSLYTRQSDNCIKVICNSEHRHEQLQINSQQPVLGKYFLLVLVHA